MNISEKVEIEVSQVELFKGHYKTVITLTTEEESVRSSLMDDGQFFNGLGKHQTFLEAYKMVFKNEIEKESLIYAEV